MPAPELGRKCLEPCGKADWEVEAIVSLRAAEQAPRAMIAVVFALPDESRNLRRMWAEKSAVGHGRERIWTGRFGGREMLLAHVGVGSEAATAATRRLLAAHGPKHLICAGYGGGLDPQLCVGDVVIDLRGDDALRASQAWSNLHVIPFFGGIASHSHALETPAEKEIFARQSGALAVDMETASVTAVCAEYGVPLIGIRAVSDTAQQALPVPMEHWFDLRRQHPRPVALMRFLARHPHRIVPFFRFVRGLPKARRALTEAVVCTILHAK